MTGVVVHAVVAMSNHVHLVVTDPAGCLPRFLQIFHRHVACCMNAALGRTENFWSSTGTSAVALDGEHDVLDKIAYVIANPVAAGLVDDPAKWNGVISQPGGGVVTASRPTVFYRPKGKMPESIELNITPPDASAYPSAEAVVAQLLDLIALRVRDATSATIANGVDCELPEHADPAMRARHGSAPEQVGALRPKFAARTRERRREALERLRAFCASYASALRAWREGDRSVAFPPGTYLMRVQHGARVEASTRSAGEPVPRVA
jgi:hypothetical protein